MSWFKKLFGTGDRNQVAGELNILGQTEYEGYLIKATEMRVGSEFQLSGTIEKDIDGVHRRSTFIRADRFPNAEQARNAAIDKARQIIAEQGEQLFAEGRDQ